MITFNPYLVFKDNCEEAFHFYKKVFGGEILYMGRYKDMPQNNREFFPESTDEQIMHATLKINAQTILLGNDNAGIYNKAGVVINNFFLHINTESQADAYRIFDELSAEGKITLPISETFWSSQYGIVIDKFGINWKIAFDPAS